MKPTFENTAGLRHSDPLSMWLWVRRGEASPAGWGCPRTGGHQLQRRVCLGSPGTTTPDLATGTHLAASDTESHVVAAGGDLNTDQRHLHEEGSRAPWERFWLKSPGHQRGP